MKSSSFRLLMWGKENEVPGSPPAQIKGGGLAPPPELVGPFSEGVEVVSHGLLDVGHRVVLGGVYARAGAQGHAQDGRGPEFGHHVTGQEALQEGRGQQGAALRDPRLHFVLHALLDVLELILELCKILQLPQGVTNRYVRLARQGQIYWSS